MTYFHTLAGGRNDAAAAQIFAYAKWLKPTFSNAMYVVSCTDFFANGYKKLQCSIDITVRL